MARVFWDTNLYIYLFEDYGALSDAVTELSERMMLRNDQLITSAITIGEILVKPRGKNNFNLCRRYEQAILSTSLVVSFDVKAAGAYSLLRQNRALRAPDAIQLACAGAANVDVFITNDNRLHGLHVDGVKFIVPVDRVPF